MSKFSGKCDFYDVIEMRGFDYIKNSEIYVGNIGPIKIEKPEDLIPYYGFLVSAGGFDKDKCNVQLSLDCYPLEYNRELIEYEQVYIKKYLKKCKRSKEEPTYEGYKNYTPFFNTFYEDPAVEKIFNALKDGKDNYLDDCLYKRTIDYFNDLIDEAESNGVGNSKYIMYLKFLMHKPLIKKES